MTSSYYLQNSQVLKNKIIRTFKYQRNLVHYNYFASSLYNLNGYFVSFVLNRKPT